MYQPDHPSGALQLIAPICEVFEELAKGQRPLSSFREQANYGHFEYTLLVAALRDKGVEIFDLGPYMIDGLAGRSPCEFFAYARRETSWLTSPVPCGGRYRAAGNTVITKLNG